MSLAETTLAPIEHTRPQKRRTIRFAYYAAVVLPIVGYIFLGNLQYRPTELPALWPNEFAVAQFVILLFPLISATVSVTGLLFYGAPKDKRPGEGWIWNSESKLIVTYVSRGNQPEVLHRATSQTRAVLDEYGVDYTLEVVTDMEIAEENRLVSAGGNVLYYVVPADYQTPRGARYKARALQYLLEQRTIRLEGSEEWQNVWVLHMDEESLATPECVYGIHEFINKYDLKKTAGAIGQGEILYNAYDYGDNLLISAIDAARTGGDLGLFRMQYRVTHKPLVGMHGSYVLTPARIEREITWDVGGHGSITEDSYFALMAMEQGVRFDWVEGFIREQSPFTVMDIIRQRRRWFCGLSQVARDPVLNFWTTFTLRAHVWFWAFSAMALPLPLIYLQQSFMLGTGILPSWLFMMAAVCTGMYASSYVVGAYRNVEHCRLPLPRKIWTVACAIIAWFFFVPALVECAGTLYGLFFPVTTFYVVAKDARRSAPAPEASDVAKLEVL
jgi:hypothetical protein